MPVDLSVFGRQKSIVDQQQLQEAFEAKKQAQQLQALGTIAALQPQRISAKDMMNFQIQQQQHQDSLGLRREQMAQAKDIATMNAQNRIDIQNDKVNEKRDLKYRNDQNLLANSLSESQKQIDLIDSLYENGKLSEGVQENFGMDGWMWNRPGSDASDAEVLLDQLNAKSFIGTIANMKQQSATGASGLGALSEREGDKIQAAAAALAGSQSDESFAKNLAKYRKEIADSQNRLKTGFDNLYGNNAAPKASGGSVDPEAAKAELKRRGVIQ